MLKQVIAGLTLTAVVGVGGVAYAQNKTSAPTATNATHGPHILRAAAQIAADTIGIDLATLRTEVKAKGSIAAVATAHNVAPQTVIDALIAKGNAAVDQAVANGKLTAARGATIKARIPTTAANFVNETINFVKNRKHRVHQRREHAAQALEIAAKTIGVDGPAMIAELKAGKSVAEVAAAHQVAVQTVVDAIVHEATSRIDAAVASGKLNATRAAALKQRLPEMITHFVNHKGPFAHAGHRAAGVRASDTTTGSLLG